MSNPNGHNSDENQSAQSGSSPEPTGDRPTPRYGQYASQNSQGSDQGGFGSPSGVGNSEESASDGGYNPYGAPSWGQPNAEQNGAAQNNPYANPYGAPEQSAPQNGAYGAAPNTPPAGWSDAGAPAGYAPPAQPGPYLSKPKRPSTLVTAMALLLAAGAAALVWGFTTMNRLMSVGLDDLFSPAEQEELAQEFNRQMQMDPNAPDISPEEAMEFMLMGLGVIAIGWAVILLAVYITFAFVGTMTGNVGRILATIWVGLSLLMLFLWIDGITLGVIALVILLGVVAVVLLWMPASSAFVAQRRQYKYAVKNPGYGYPPQGGTGYPQDNQHWNQNQ